MTAGLTFLGGTNTVGGVQILVSGQTGRLVFDLGVVGNPAIVRHATLFNPLLPARDHSALLDYLRAGMAPLIENLYDPAQLLTSVRAATQRLRATGFLLADFPLIDDTDRDDICVFISHLHEDHMLLLPFVAPNVQVLMSERGARLHEALVMAGAVAPAVATVTGVAAGSSHQVGDLSVEVIEVDHDVPGAAGILIRTPDGCVAYTGDWRLHGRHPDLMKTFVEKCAGVDILLTEASTATTDLSGVATLAAAPALQNVTERDVGEAFDAFVATARRGVYCSFHERNLERQSEIRDIAVSHKRILVLSARSYAIWQRAAAAGFSGLDVSSGVAVWADDGINAERVDARDAEAVTPSDVADDPQAFVCELRRWDRPRLLDMAAGPGDIYVHMNGYPHGPADPGWQVLETWTKELGIRFEAVSSHGHALLHDLQWLVEAVHPRVVVPVHTNAPDHFPATSVPVRTVRRGDVMSFSGELM
ncbi:MAG: MBL fold metallo-hydrolase [Acidothermaceae bacterium]